MRQTIYKNLPCELTREEIATYSEELANITSRTAEIESEKKEVMSDFAAKLNKCIADSRVLARKITNRREDRQVECDLDFDYAKGIVYTVRTDTGVTIDQRKLSDSERQQWLDLDAEETKLHEAEDAAAEAADQAVAAEPVEDPEEGVTVCVHTACENYLQKSPNGCGQFEHAYECPDAIGEVVSLVEPKEEKPVHVCDSCRATHPSCTDCCNTCTDKCNGEQMCCFAGAAPITVVETETVPAEPAALDPFEISRRCDICKTWIDCEHKDICFTPENEIEGICFIDSPQRLPAAGVNQKAVNRLVHTSADDCKTSLNFETDMAVLHAALEECTNSGQKTKAKHISARINQLERLQAPDLKTVLDESNSKCFNLSCPSNDSAFNDRCSTNPEGRKIAECTRFMSRLTASINNPGVNAL